MKRSRSVVYLSGEKIGIETNCKVLAKFFEMLRHGSLSLRPYDHEMWSIQLNIYKLICMV